MTREFRVRREQDLPATPQQVWNAVATGAGNLGWLYPMEVEPHVGGAVTRGHATVVEWKPPHRFACRSEDGKGFSNTLSYAIEPGNDGISHLSMGIHWVHEGTVDDGWDTRADAAEKHVDFYQHSLAEYLRHFEGRRATYVKAGRPAPPAHADVFTALLRQAGLTDGTAVGDTVRFRVPDGLGGPRDAVVDYLSGNFLGLRTTDGLYRFFNGYAWNWPIWLGHHLFTDPVDEKQATQEWKAWLEKAAP
ncbi:SRPBCC family protein [Streptomyces colonosanans]|uniref:ATPase n=1 Tax=Streptomyces colonosanans TaxID=1428652 RepID=A0A1S2PMH7_9ACTN|nr:ATPase [Streptomyces colonosanans]OIJ94114.1 ATPase [Streptomyces colonosanans]